VPKKISFPKGQKVENHENLKTIKSLLYSVSVLVDIESQSPPQCSTASHVMRSVLASMPMPGASAFQHTASQNDTGAFRYRTGSPYFSAGLAPSLAFFSFRYGPLPECTVAADYLFVRTSPFNLAGERRN
jgi:hypothetical protein